MKSINVYQRYYAGDCLYNNVQRHGVLVTLLYEFEEGNYSYTVQLIFFPHRDPEDYAISYDAVFEKNVLKGTGRRSRKKEEVLLEHLQESCNQLAGEAGGTVYWENPLTEERRG